METWNNTALKIGNLIYLPNDSSTPNLLTEIPIPSLPNPCPPVNIAGWVGSSGTPGTPQFQAALVYVTIIETLKMIWQTGHNFTNWSFNRTLIVMPRAGNDFNAYYDRNALKFFYNLDKEIKKIIFCCESSDVVSHELGHAILDVLRPDLWHTACLEIFAFHESFGDIMAICSILNHPKVVDMVLKETSGDISKSNVCSRIAEELGMAIYHISGGKSGNKDCLRNAVNNFTYQPPELLPADFPIKKEPHSFSQIFTGAWYDCLVAVYNEYIKENNNFTEALIKSRDTMLKIIIGATISAVSINTFYESMAKSILQFSNDVENGKFVHLFKEVFSKRNILHSSAMHKTMFNTETIDPSVNGNKAKLDSNVIVHLPTFTYDAPHNVSVVAAAEHAVQYADSKNLIGNKEECSMFSIDDETFVRNYICNSFCKDCH